MTIGIAASGKNAGLAIFRALKAVEAVGSGCIGGFASLAAITDDRDLVRAVTQRGGSSTLFVVDERTGTDPPPRVAEAPIAALMSSGPDRPEPLAQFVAGDPRVGLVTGHRYAHAQGANGVAFNQDVLDRMMRGVAVGRAVDAVADENRNGDVGLIGIDMHGNIHARNTDRVAVRVDGGSAEHSEGARGSSISILHNAIHPVAGIAAMAVDVAMETMRPRSAAEFWIEANAGTRVVLGDCNFVRVDGDLRVLEVVTTDPSLLRGRRDGSPIYIEAHVWQEGKRLGYTVFEPYAVLVDGVIESLIGQRSLRVGCRRAE
ncbi:MAG: hypothetical protein OXQ29_01235 [Rhodospirillaceae bacterium]|nr:hypothetical protein [Rhodospirillaceae bacterium]